MEIKPKRPTAKGPAESFTGDVWVDGVHDGQEPSWARVSIVRFSPGARSAWHSHALGQTLYVTEGTGRAQTRGGPIIEVTAGDIVHSPADEEHWHGAAPDHFMAHLSVTEGTGDADKPATRWGAHVTDTEYNGQPGQSRHETPSGDHEPNMAAGPSRAQELLGDFAPKLVSLTDTVLFGDIWERPGLSKRDRSLVTVAALVALCRTDQMAGHMKRAVDNGLTIDELVEAITHLAFYAGWPSAMTAMTTAKKLFDQAS